MADTEKSGDESAQDLIRNIRHQAGYTGKDAEPLSTRPKPKKRVVKEDLGAALKLAYGVATHPLTPIAVRAFRKKFRKKKKVEEGSRGLKRLTRKMKAGHIPRIELGDGREGSPSVNQKIKDTEDRHKEARSGVDPNTRPKNVKGMLASLDKGHEDSHRMPNVLRTTHELAKSPDPQAEKEYAQSIRVPHVVKAVKRAHSRSVGTFVPGRDQTGTVTTLAQQRKEDPTVDKDISDKAKAYRKIRSRRVPPSMN